LSFDQGADHQKKKSALQLGETVPFNQKTPSAFYATSASLMPASTVLRCITQWTLPGAGIQYLPVSFPAV